MQKPTQKLRKVSIELFVLVSISFLLLLTGINIQKYLEPRKVLGVGTALASNDDEFWENFVAKNPNYLPGWLALGRMDKVREIDPNWEADTSDKTR